MPPAGRNGILMASSSTMGPSFNAEASSSGTSTLADLFDDTEEEMDCPLCMEEMDISDLNFKPCPCGYQICRFCWHHIKENLNGRCPACRTPYDDSAVKFKPLKPEEIRRLQTAKKQREREKKDNELLSRKPLANVRVKHKSQVRVENMTAKLANEDTLPILRDNDHFGKYGKILKIFVSRRSNAAGGFTHPQQEVVNVYINFLRSQDASACIAGVDGSLADDGTELRASWGTTKYCTAFLRGQKCLNDTCQQAHELGEEVDANERARQDMATLKHAMKESEHRGKPSDAKKDAPGLPASASWASKNAAVQPPQPVAPPAPVAPSTAPPASSYPTLPPPAPASNAPPYLQAPIGRGQRLARPPSLAVPPRPRVDSRRETNGRLTPQTNSTESSDTEAPPVASTSTATPPVLAAAPEPVEETFPAFEDADYSLSPHPIDSDFDHTLNTFGSGSFSFSLRADVKGKERAPIDSVLKSSTSATSRPPALSMREALDQIRPDASTPALYTGAFDPFGNGFDGAANEENERKGSRFGFAKRASTPSALEYGMVEAPMSAARYSLPPASTTSAYSRQASPATSGGGGQDELSAAAALWANARSPYSEHGPTAASSPLPPLPRSARSAASMPLPPSNPNSAPPTSLPPGLGGYGRPGSAGGMLSASAYPLPPATPARAPSSDYYNALSSGHKQSESTSGFTDPAILSAHYGHGVPSAAYQALPSPSNHVGQQQQQRQMSLQEMVAQAQAAQQHGDPRAARNISQSMGMYFTQPRR